jgi:hypothetical protein
MSSPDYATPLYIEIEPNNIIALHVALQAEFDPDSETPIYGKDEQGKDTDEIVGYRPFRVVLTYPAPAYYPSEPLIFDVTGDLARLVLAYFQKRATEGLATLRAYVDS